MEFIQITPENLEKEHICCAISGNKDCQVMSKKAWLSERMKEGLVFLKADARGKCFIEYLPAEAAWAPIEAEDYMYIDCFWVSGALKGNGYSNFLLEECIQDSRKKGKRGLVILSSEKKRGFLSEPEYLRYKGFRTADCAAPYFELLYLPFEENAPVPKFKSFLHDREKRQEQCCQDLEIPPQEAEGFVLYYTHQCPFTAKYVPLLKQYADEKGLPFMDVYLDSREKAQNAPTPFTSYSLFYKGKFVTHEILSVKKFEAIVRQLGI